MNMASHPEMPRRDAAPDPREKVLRHMFDAAVRSASPALCVPPHLPNPPRGRTVVVGAGKAAAGMARAVEDNWAAPLSGVVVTRYGHGVPCRRIEVLEAAHPVPDEAGLEATRRIFHAVSDLTRDDLVICLLSGGGSALMPAPAPGLTLADEREVASALLKCGATIAEMNCIRKHISTIKGGRLAAAAAPARLVTLAISDVPGDDPSVIASGPTVADPTTRHAAAEILARYGIAVPAVMKWLSEPASETPKPGQLESSAYVLVATPQKALDAAADVALRRGYTPLILGNAIEGEAREVALVHARIARQVRDHGQPAPAPCALLSGGETTVTVRGDGRGGRNVEFLLALALALNGAPGISALAADTDGIDGTEDNAGAIIGPHVLAAARDRGLSPAASLSRNDGYGFFSATGSLLVTGPTMTNVNDFRAILIDAPEAPSEMKGI
jgi:hydroxypyruvate reductase